ncbi:MAG: twin-arginine translocase TatA/TatE family subunit [Flavobacteriia bacterium]|nr:twin-arginine translocase TatA/TatE family subunit [Flavobacteriia bacterium]
MLLFLNDIAGSEVLLILLFILIFFGSKSIPGIAKSLGRTMHQIKEASNEVQNEIKKSGLDIKKDMNFSQIIRETNEEIQRPLDQSIHEIENAVSYTPPSKIEIPSQSLSENQTPVEQKPLDQQLD